MRRHVTADEVYEEVLKNYPHISRGTVYRNLNKLAQEGKIGRVPNPMGAERFDFITKPHYHVRCDICGNFFDVDMEYIRGMEKNILNAHGFTFTGCDIIFRGICPECQEKTD